MSSIDLFCLKWTSHESTLISKLDALLSNENFCDCTLAAEGQHLNVHKFVLSACSPYFESLLNLYPTERPIIILKDITYDELKAMVEYMYKGEVNILQDQLDTFIKSAESLQISGLSGNDNDNKIANSSQIESLSRKPSVPPPAPQIMVKSSPAPTVARRGSDSSRDGATSPSLRKKRRMQQLSNGEDANQTISVTRKTPNAQSTPVNVPSTPVTIPSPIVPDLANPKSEYDQSDPVPPESGLLKEKIEPMTEILLEPKTEYIEYLNDDADIEDLTLDDDEDDEINMSEQAGPSHETDQNYDWSMTGEQIGSGDEVFMAASNAVNAQRDAQGERHVNRKSETNFELIKTLNDTVHICTTCGRHYSYASSLYTHQKYECGKDPSFKCMICGSTYHHKHRLKYHMQTKHSVAKDLGSNTM
uniref:BTB domain-containing protein n=1 Tax=Clastoptera arizonana TaxID=38151 RepID=A0A1B6D500_9HEMI